MVMKKYHTRTNALKKLNVKIQNVLNVLKRINQQKFAWNVLPEQYPLNSLAVYNQVQPAMQLDQIHTARNAITIWELTYALNAKMAMS